jgi:hypothetical protein
LMNQIVCSMRSIVWIIVRARRSTPLASSSASLRAISDVQIYAFLRRFEASTLRRCKLFSSSLTSSEREPMVSCRAVACAEIDRRAAAVSRMFWVWFCDRVMECDQFRCRRGRQFR